MRRKLYTCYFFNDATYNRIRWVGVNIADGGKLFSGRGFGSDGIDLEKNVENSAVEFQCFYE